jgi:peptidoglycan hydrolase-like amidase
MRNNLQKIPFNLINLVTPTKSFLKTESCNIPNILNILVLFALTITISISVFLNIPIAVTATTPTPIVTANTSVSAPISGFSGKVTDLCSGEPIAEAVISIESLGLSTTTNSRGEYLLEVPFPPASLLTLAPETYEVSAQAAGYIDMSATRQEIVYSANEADNADTADTPNSPNLPNLITLNFEMILLNPTAEQEEIIEKKLQAPPVRLSSRFDPGFLFRPVPSRVTTLPSTITVLMPNGEVEEMDLDEYVKGVIPQEMPASWPKDALKAQAIAAKCYAATHPNKWNHPEADVCTSPNCCQCWSPYHYATTDQAVIETSNIMAAYQGNIIQSFYFSHCDGHTRNIEDVWDGTEVAVPYCRSVSCICGYTTLYAHGVGMCQWGAKEMASRGDNFQEILFHYYTGIAVTFSTTSPTDTPLLGDFGSADNGPPDGVVDFEDLIIFSLAYDSRPSDSNWNPACDIAGPNGGLIPDGVIDFEDLMVFAMNYGKTQTDKINLIKKK